MSSTPPEQQTTKPKVPYEVYGTLVSQVHEAMVQKLVQSAIAAINNPVDRMHILFHSTGGFVNDGIAAYNFLRAIPLDVVLYNVGCVQSIAVTVFLGAKKRKASKAATFMIHRAMFSTPIPASSAQLQAQAQSIAVDNARVEAILRAHIKMPEEKWEIHNHVDLHLSAAEALEYGIIDEIAEFSVPLGGHIFNVIS